MNIIWLSSYPRSGSTWLRFFLHSYLYGPPQSSIEVARTIPDLHKEGRLDAFISDALWSKTHFKWSENHPHAHQTAGFIYILRHPKDILLSSLNYCKMEGYKTSNEGSAFATDFINNMGVSAWMNNGFGNWPDHIYSWLHNPSVPYLIVRYEDMLEFTEPTFRKILGFLDLEVNETQMRQAMVHSSFENLRRLEIKEKEERVASPVFSISREHSDTYSFINKGKCKQSLAELGPDLDEIFDRRFEEVLGKVGYGI